MIDLALQKARCLRKLYRMQESVEVLAGYRFVEESIEYVKREKFMEE